jgi:hypothetical protein
MKTCVITVGDYAKAMPHWRFHVMPGDRMSATHPAGAELVFDHSDNPVIGDKAEILEAQVELFCDLAKRFLVGRIA